MERFARRAAKATRIENKEEREEIPSKSKSSKHQYGFESSDGESSIDDSSTGDDSPIEESNDVIGEKTPTERANRVKFPFCFHERFVDVC